MSVRRSTILNADIHVLCVTTVALRMSPSVVATSAKDVALSMPTPDDIVNIYNKTKQKRKKTYKAW